MRAVAYQSELYEIAHIQSYFILDVVAEGLPVEGLYVCGMDNGGRERVEGELVACDVNEILILLALIPDLTPAPSIATACSCLPIRAV